jgi:SAM-dependent methyltransferase
MDRNDIILKNIDKTMTGMEIGPSYNPVCPKRDGWNVYVVDHADRDELVSKYEELRQRASQAAVNFGTVSIEEVDIVWKEGNLAELFVAQNIPCVDFIVASHVIEHVPCLVSFLHSLEQVVVPGGIVSLAIPDRRRTFDFFKPTSSTADVIEAYWQNRSRHTVRTCLLQLFYDCRCGSNETWGDPPVVEELMLMHNFKEVSNRLDKCDISTSSQYLDFHAWFFTPASFELTMLELNALGLTRLSVEAMTGTRGCEFFAQLRRQQKAPPTESINQRRIELLLKMHDEHSEQDRQAAAEVDCARDAEPPAGPLDCPVPPRSENPDNSLKSAWHKYDSAYYAWKGYRRAARHTALNIIDDQCGVAAFILLYPLYKILKPFFKAKRFLQNKRKAIRS